MARKKKRMDYRKGRLKYVGVEMPIPMYDAIKAAATKEDLNFGQMTRRILKAWIAEHGSPQVQAIANAPPPTDAAGTPGLVDDADVGGQG